MLDFKKKKKKEVSSDHLPMMTVTKAEPSL